jgi:hypothetical protein
MKTITTLAVTALIGSQAIPNPAAAQVSARTETRVEARAQLRQSSAQQPSQQGSAQETSRQSGSVSAESVVRATAEAGLPEAPVRRTIAEGQAKGAAEADVVRAALRTQGRLVLAREALESPQREPSQNEIALAGEVLARGGSRADLEKVADAAPSGRSLEASLQAMLSLGGSGQTTSQIASSIAAQLAAGASDQSLRALGGLNVSGAVGGALGGVTGGASAAGSLTGTVSGAVGGTGASSTSGSTASGSGAIGAGVIGSVGRIVP